MPVEQRGQVIAIWVGSTGNGRSPTLNGRRQPSRGGTSRMTRECHVRICEGLGVKFPGPTRHLRLSTHASLTDGLPPIADGRALGLAFDSSTPNSGPTRAAGRTEGSCH